LPITPKNVGKMNENESQKEGFGDLMNLIDSIVEKMEKKHISNLSNLKTSKDQLKYIKENPSCLKGKNIHNVLLPEVAFIVL